MNDLLDAKHFLPVLIGVAGLCALLARNAPRRAPSFTAPPDGARDISPSLAAALVMGAMLWRVAALFIMAHERLVIFEGDQVARWSLSYGWRNDPFFFTGWDGIWLSGNFAYFGTWMRLFRDPLIGTLVGVLLGHFLTIFAACFLGWTLSRRLWVGVVAAWFMAPSFIFLWIGHGPLVEGTLAAFFMLALAFARRFAESDRFHPKAQWLYAAGAGLFFFFTASLHYLGWMAIIVTLIFLLAVFWIRRATLGRNGFHAALLTFLGSALFPLLWMACSWWTFGNAFQFLRNENTVNQTISDSLNLSRDLQEAVRANLTLLADGASLLLPLSLMSFFLYRGGTAIRAWLMFNALIAGIVLLMAVSGYISGIHFISHRHVIIPSACLLVSFAVALSAVERAWAGAIQSSKARQACISVCFGLILIPWLDYNARMAARQPEYSRTQGWPHDVFALAAWLQMEFHTPQSDGFAKRRVHIGVCDPDSPVDWLDFLKYQTGHPKSFLPVSVQDLDSGNVSPGLEYLILGKDHPAQGFGLVTQIGRWRVLERRETPSP